MKYRLIALLLLATVAALAQTHSVTLTWPCSGPCITADNPTGFIALRGTTSGGPYAIVVCTVTAVAASNTCQDTMALVEGTTYYYVVETTAAGGAVSANSPEASATVPFLKPQPPVQLTAAAK